jgi:hypothetical protein
MWTQQVFVFELVQVLVHTALAKWSVASARASEAGGKPEACKMLKEVREEGEGGGGGGGGRREER